MRITSNAQQFAATFERSLQELVRRMTQGVNEAALQMERTAKENLKGDARGKHLLASIHTQAAEPGIRVTAQVGVGAATGIDGEAGENFGIYVHEGTGIYSRTGMGRKEVPWFYMDDQGNGHLTSGMQSNPFLENAFNSEKERAQQIIADAVRNG